MSKRPERAAAARRLEVARPDALGVLALHLPDVAAVVVDRALADEVDRADHVVEGAAGEQLASIRSSRAVRRSRPRSRRAGRLAARNSQ